MFAQRKYFLKDIYLVVDMKQLVCCNNWQLIMIVQYLIGKMSGNKSINNIQTNYCKVVIKNAHIEAEHTTTGFVGTLETQSIIHNGKLTLTAA